MSVPFAERGLVGKAANLVTEAVRFVQRGYTDAQLKTATTILDGIITPQDRARFKQKEKERLFAIHFPQDFMSRDFMPPGQSQFYSPKAIDQYIEAVRTLEALPEEELDWRLQQSERQKIERWLGLKQRG